MSTLEEAITQKYLSEEEEANKDTCVIFAPRRNDRLIPATIVINNCTIERLGNFQRIRELCSGIKELDLAQNEILDVQEVLRLLEGLSRLTFLNLSCNNLRCLCGLPNNLPCYGSLRRLVLNGTLINWDVVAEFLEKISNLEELYLCLNEYKQVQLNCGKQYPYMKLVHLSGNPITSWDEFMKIGKVFPNLETLVIVDCEVNSFSSESEFETIFYHLSTLNMNNNKLSQWDEIDKLRLFPSLQDIRVLGLPFYEEYTAHERRQLLIGRLPNVSRLNGSHISSSEREDAERAFIRYYMGKEGKPGRYYELEAKHGKLDPLVEVDLAPQFKVTVMIQYGEHKMVHNLQLKQTVNEFKSSLQEFTGLQPVRMRLFYLDKGSAPCPEEMKYGNKKLYSYCVRDGDEFYIIEKLNV